LDCTGDNLKLDLSKSTTPWFIHGEGYAAKFVVYIADRLQGNNLFKLNLKGIILSNPFVCPEAIISEIPAYAYNMGLIDPQERSLYERASMNGVLNIVKN